MPDINEFTFWKASSVQNPKNCTYLTKVIVTDADSFNEMAHFDHVTAEYENCYRSNDTFLQSDVQSGDVDNDNAGNPDEWITKEDIFHLCVQGYGVSQIATEITSRHIKNPTAHAKANGINPPDNRKDAGEYYWGSSTISHIFTRQEYLGHTVNFKTYRKSYKQKK